MYMNSKGNIGNQMYSLCMASMSRLHLGYEGYIQNVEINFDETDLQDQPYKFVKIDPDPSLQVSEHVLERFKLKMALFVLMPGIFPFVLDFVTIW